MNIKSMTDGGLTFDQAMELHRLHHECCMSYSQISRSTGLNPAMVMGVLTGRYFPRRGEAMGEKA